MNHLIVNKDWWTIEMSITLDITHTLYISPLLVERNFNEEPKYKINAKPVIILYN